jgi:Transposase DDE domain
VVEIAASSGVIAPEVTVAIDSTGLETRHISRYYQWRKGELVEAFSYPKLTTVCDLRSHLWLAAEASFGPSPDAPQFAPAVTQAVANHPIRRLLADRGYDSERNHVICREQLDIRSTVIPARRVPHGTRRLPKTKYRRQMRRRHNLRGYGQRWQIESSYSRHKRLLGTNLRSRGPAAQCWELLLRVLTHDVMLIAAN